MESNKKIAVLTAKFNLLKDTYKKDDEECEELLMTIAEKIIAPILGVDMQRGAEMWEYILKRYYGKCYPYEYGGQLIDSVIENTDTHTLLHVFTCYKTIREYVFLRNPYENHYYTEGFLVDLVLEKQYQAAEQFLSLYMRNNKGENDAQKNLYSFLRLLVNSSEARWKMDSFGIGFIQKWLTTVEDEKKRARLEVSLIDLEECILGNVAKGAVPFSMIKKHLAGGETVNSILTDMAARDNQKND